MGSGGMIAAEFAATLGVHVVVVERSRVGGDCLWTGCVPSKALLASAKAAHYMRNGDHYGLPSVEPSIDLSLVWDRIRKVQHDIAGSDDNPERYRDELGVEVRIGSAARLTGPNSLAVGDDEIDARFILLCTGSRPAVPPLEGLVEAGFLTSENVFELEQPPRSCTFIGGGPIAVEMAQAFNRLGIRTTLLQKGARICPRDEPDLVDILMAKVRREGVDVVTDADTTRVTVEGETKVVHAVVAGEERRFSAEEILVAAGRKPNVEGLGLEDVGVTTGPRGVEVDDRMRTSVPSIYAAGDLAGRYLFTHSAGYEAVQAIRDMFFPGKGKAPEFVPWCTFTDPELAHAGMTIAEGHEKYGDDLEVWRQDLSHSDRARADGSSEGAVVVVTHKKRIVGAHILAPAAGEMIHELALAIREGIKLTDLAGMVHVYPTLSIAIGQVASEAAYARAEKLRWLVRKEKH
jgi:pyruvate/2-oxoglutarate dehydrogenase complex dihydrolipoamide dehydrogenase (E3) component